jgi:hypothetical protein
MRTENKRRPRAFDTYVKAHQCAYAWAEKAVRHRCAGKFPQAKDAVEKVQSALRKISVLEAQAARGAPKHAKA